MTVAVGLAVAGLALGAVSAYSAYEQGQAQKRQYNLQAKQTTVEGERRALQYEQRANDLLRRRRATNATLAARAAAGGVDPFSGSPDILRAANDTAMGRDYVVLLNDVDAALRGGAFQSTLYESAGATAARGGVFSAATKFLGSTIDAASTGIKAQSNPTTVVED
jgi:hypothetical protein